jgi:hypothetical protein
LFLALLCLFAPGNAFADGCGESAVGKSFSVHGRYSIYVEGDAIWIVGTKRLLSTTDDDLDKMIMAKGEWQDYVIYGDSVVCPMTPYISGHKQTVRIVSYKNLRFAVRQ